MASPPVARSRAHWHSRHMDDSDVLSRPVIAVFGPNPTGILRGVQNCRQRSAHVPAAGDPGEFLKRHHMTITQSAREAAHAIDRQHEGASSPSRDHRGRSPRKDFGSGLGILKTGCRETLGEAARAELGRLRVRLCLEQVQIDVVESERDRIVRQGKPVAGAVASDERTPARIALLTELKGIGATLPVNGVFCRKVRNRPKLAGRFGLIPTPWASGAVERDQGIGRDGRPMLSNGKAVQAGNQRRGLTACRSTALDASPVHPRMCGEQVRS